MQSASSDGCRYHTGMRREKLAAVYRMKQTKISVIVPVYNTRQYLRQCLDSIIGQDYQSLDIILVDDGSTDGSGAICDEYAARDRRIRVIHQPNSGVSAARNHGLEIADGEWIGWVDSDDWIRPEMYGYLLEYAERYDADIAVCSRHEFCNSYSNFYGWEQDLLLDTEQALELLLKNKEMQNFLWDKLWKRELFDSISFPEGQTFEDIAVMHRLFLAAERIVCLPEAMYYYRQRSGSIVDNQSLENRINHYRAAKLRMDEMYGQWPQFHHLLEAQCVASSVMIWCGYYANSKVEREQYQTELKEIADFAGSHYRSALLHMKLGMAGRIVLRLLPYPTWWAFRLSFVISLLYKYRHGRSL